MPLIFNFKWTEANIELMFSLTWHIMRIKWGEIRKTFFNSLTGNKIFQEVHKWVSAASWISHARSIRTKNSQFILPPPPTPAVSLPSAVQKWIVLETRCQGIWREEAQLASPLTRCMRPLVFTHQNNSYVYKNDLKKFKFMSSLTQIVYLKA